MKHSGTYHFSPKKLSKLLQTSPNFSKLLQTSPKNWRTFGEIGETFSNFGPTIIQRIIFPAHVQFSANEARSRYVLHNVRNQGTSCKKYYHHHASLLKSSIKQVNCVGAWALRASLSHSLIVATLCCSVFHQPSGLSLSNTMRDSSADQHSSS